jgi:uncharacterized repeat protein (TIGR03803 family)
LYGATVTQPFRFNRTSGALEFLTERSPAVVAMTADSNGVVYAGIKYRCVVLEVYLGSCYVLDAFVGSSVIELHQFKPPDGCGEFGCQGNEIVTALLATPGALYGAGGPTQFFRYDASGFHALPPVGAVRRNVSGLTLATDGRIYGVNSDGGSDGNGCAFRLDADGTVTILQCFAGGSDVGAIEGGLVETADGTFLGLMVVSDPPTGGLAYGLTPSGEFSVRHHFEGNAEGSLPTHLIQSTDGALYGTTMMGGGLLNSGTIYRLADRGSVDVLHAVPSFRLETTVDATPTLMQATDGMLYATYIDTSFGGVFRVTTSGAYEHVHSFWESAASDPAGSLIQARDGLLYGTTRFSGVNIGGTVFQLQPDGSVTILHQFDGTTEGMRPAAGVLQGSDGAFYGTTSQGGPLDAGTVFRMAGDGSVTVLHAFNGPAEGAGSVAPLIQARDGSFYGTTFTGGSANLGTVFRLTPAGSFSVVHTFTGADGANPSAALTETADGTLHGVTQRGGANGRGAVFKLTASGAFTLVHSFTGADGERPTRALVQGDDGYLYGTAERGGPSGGGVVFRLVDVSCEDTLTVGYAGGTLNITFHIRSVVPSTWSAWLVARNQVFPIWSVPVPAVTPAVSFAVPVANFPHLGSIGVLTTLANPSVGAVCGDWKTIDTGLR